MKLSQKEMQGILDAINLNTASVVASNVGTNYLLPSEIEILEKYGIDIETLYKEHKDPLLLNFHLGLLSEKLSDGQLNQISGKDLSVMIREGQHVPLSRRERLSLDNVRRQSLSDIRSMGGKIFNDVNGIISSAESSNRESYEAVIRQEVTGGLAKRKTSAQIARDIGKKTGDWSRDFNRIVQYVSHSALDAGRAEGFRRATKDGEKVRVYKQVFAGSCKHCIRLYLTAGIGSKPIIFDLEALEKNGTNIGRKVNDCKPVLGSTHPYCRCTVRHVKPNYEWNEEKKKFIPIKIETNRAKIRVVVGDKEFFA